MTSTVTTSRVLLLAAPSPVPGDASGSARIRRFRLARVRRGDGASAPVGPLAARAGVKPLS